MLYTFEHSCAAAVTKMNSLGNKPLDFCYWKREKLILVRKYIFF